MSILSSQNASAETNLDLHDQAVFKGFSGIVLWSRIESRLNAKPCVFVVAGFSGKDRLKVYALPVSFSIVAQLKRSHELRRMLPSWPMRI